MIYLFGDQGEEGAFAGDATEGKSARGCAKNLKPISALRGNSSDTFKSAK